MTAFSSPAAGPDKLPEGVEVLSPAGGREALEAAVRAGADAVYLGGRAFGARANAKNFSREELRQAVETCHARGVRVHVTVNILLKDSELPEALAFVEFLCGLPVDAVLVQDVGLLALLRQRAPALPVHASTQMSLHTPAGVRLAEELGATRAVLARELSLREIREIREGCGVELEAFVHGALCMCVSGQCLLSAMLGGRSGNRGQCAQPCRLPFAAPGGTGCDLSLKDLSFAGQIHRLREAGVCSMKVEGRMKRPEYVAAATAACRLAADGLPVPEELSQKLEAVFSRSGFTDGYLTGRRGREMFGTRRKEDVTAATEKVLGSLRGLYRGERQSVPVSLTLSEEAGQLTLTAEDGEGRCAQARAPGSGEHRTPAERAEQQLRKTGGTPFKAGAVTVPEEVSLSIPELNALRRWALEGLLEARAGREAIPFSQIPLPEAVPHRRQGKGLAWRASFRQAGQVCPEALACEEIALPVETGPQDLAYLREAGPKILLDLPRAVFGWEERLRELMLARMEMGFTDFICGNLGALQLCRELGATPHGAFSLNIANTAALEEFARLGLATAELSQELSGRETGALGGTLPRGVMVYGRQALMLTRNCPLANSPRGCLHCKAPGYLTDRKGKKFPVLCRGLGREKGIGGIELFNSVPLWLGDLQEELAGVDFGILRFTVENSVECGEILRAVRAGKICQGSYTRGLFRRGVE